MDALNVNSSTIRIFAATVFAILLAATPVAAHKQYDPGAAHAEIKIAGASPYTGSHSEYSVGFKLSGAFLDTGDFYPADLSCLKLGNVAAHLGCFGLAVLRDTDLRNVRAFKSNLIGARLNETTPKRANLEGAGLRGANVEGANLLGADLRGVNLQGAVFEGANLRGASVQGAGLLGADLRGVNLQGVNLQGAVLEGAVLEETKINK